MKSIFKLSCLLSLFLMSISSYSQIPGFSIEGRAGVNFLKPDVGEYKVDTKVGYRFEAIARLTMPSNVFIQSGLGFSQKKSEYYMEGIGDTDGDGFIDYVSIGKEVSIRYFHLPVMFGYKYNITSDFSVNAAAGFYFGYGVGGKYKSQTVLINSNIEFTPENLENITIDDFEKVQLFEDNSNAFGDGGIYKRADVGVRFDIGAEYKRILLNAGYEHGFTDISKSKAGNHNRNFFISLGFRIL